jgi:hypothetical protein
MELQPLNISKVFGELPARMLALGDVLQARQHLPVVARDVPRKPMIRLQLRLTDGRRIHVNGRSVSVPKGVGPRVTVAAIREMAGIYRGHTVYLGSNGSAVRIRDKDVIELVDGASFTSRDETPQTAVSAPAYHKD